MASKKVENLKESGEVLWSRYGHPGDDYVAVVAYRKAHYTTEDGTIGDGTYFLTFHHGVMPSFGSKQFKTAEACEARMRELEPDLRKWKKVG